MYLKSSKKKYLQELFSNGANIEYWESIYSRRDFAGFILQRRMYQALSWLGNLNLSKDSRVLDVGCGPGVMVKEIAGKGHRVFGMDYSYNMIQKAEARCNVHKRLNLVFLQGDIESLPFKESVFDVILCLGVVSYLKSEQKALQEMSRVLKSGGTLILSILNRTSLTKWLDPSAFVRRKINKILDNKVVKSYFIPSLRNSLRIAGFTELDYAAVQYGPFTIFGWTIFPSRLNINITNFIEKFSRIPFVKSLGNMCVFKLRKKVRPCSLTGEGSPEADSIPASAAIL